MLDEISRYRCQMSLQDALGGPSHLAQQSLRRQLMVEFPFMAKL